MRCAVIVYTQVYRRLVLPTPSPSAANVYAIVTSPTNGSCLNAFAANSTDCEASTLGGQVRAHA